MSTNTLDTRPLQGDHFSPQQGHKILLVMPATQGGLGGGGKEIPGRANPRAKETLQPAGADTETASIDTDIDDVIRLFSTAFTLDILCPVLTGCSLQSSLVPSLTVSSPQPHST